METALTINSTAITGTLTNDLFKEYISFIDRSKATARAYIINLRQFAAYLKYKLIVKPARQDVIAFRDWLQSEHEAIQLTAAGEVEYRTDNAGNRITVTCKPNTVKAYLRSVCAFFRWTASAGYYPNIAENVHTPKVNSDEHQKNALKPGQVSAIESSILKTAAQRTNAAADRKKDCAGSMQRSDEQGKRLYAMFLLATNAGLRTIEISRANIADVETVDGESSIRIWGKGHGGADTVKPIAPEVKAAIDDYIASRTDRPTKSSPLFTSTGNRSHGKRIAVTTISTMLKRAMQDAGFDSDRLTAHSLRHTCGTTVLQITGQNLYQTQQYMRHSSPKTTEIYLHTDNQKQNTDIAQRLYNAYHGKETDNRDTLEAAAEGLTAEQTAQLAAIARAMKGAKA